MFIRPCYRKKNGKRHAYWALVESYRTDLGPRQRVVAYLGQLKEAQRLGVKQAVEGKWKKSPYQQLRLFDCDDRPEPEWVEVDTANMRVENQLDFGGPWLALELIRKLKLDKLLESVMPQGREDIPWARMAIVLAISRLCNPSSELHIAEHYYAKTAMPELLGIPSEKVYDERLYRAAGLGDEPRRIFEELGQISVVDVVLPTRSGVEIRRRCVRRPTDHQAILLQRLGLSLPRQITS